MSTLHPTISVGQLETKSKDDDLYTRRQVQDIVRRIFSETFFEADEKIKERGVPDIVKPYSTVFSPHTEPKLDNPILVRGFEELDYQPALAFSSASKAVVEVVPEIADIFYAILFGGFRFRCNHSE